ncbi:DUF3360 family protein [Vibrio lentus]|nr:DUF3360 family protein [Vibrio lentus]
MAATIGKVVMVGAIAATFAGALRLNEGTLFTKNVRCAELLMPLCFHCIIFLWLPVPTQTCGTAAPLIPLTNSDCRCSRRTPYGVWLVDWRFLVSSLAISKVAAC